MAPEAGARMKQRAILVCSQCGARRDTTVTPGGQPRIPSQSGWKRRPVGLYCRECWLKAYRLVCVILPIRPQEPEQWPALRPVLAALWGETTSLANWAIHELMKADIVRVDQEKLAKAELPYLYGLAGERYPNWQKWEGKKQAAQAILRMAEARWRNDRHAVLWMRSQAAPTFRYGVPYPLDADAWRVERGNGGAYLLTCGLGSSWTFALGTGNQGRNRSALKQLVAGQAIAVEAALYERRRSLGDHRAGTAQATPGGGMKNYKRLYAKLVCWMPRGQQAAQIIDPEKRLYVRTGQDVFWSALLAGEEEASAWKLHADHVKRWIIEYLGRLDKLADDFKYEKRWPKRVRVRLAHHREAVVARQKRRIDTWIHQATAALVGYACRRRVAEVIYREDGYCCNPFPWFRLRETLRQKLDAQAIGFTVASAEVINDRQAELGNGSPDAS